jgi:ArsR family transcriptional regulator, arsenate/arsenite/antimonite-responsive transcriptional repressor
MNELLTIFKALSDETRLNIVNLLLKHDFCVGALAKHTNVSEAAVSQHLQVLRKAGLVKGEKRGYYVHYGVNRDFLRVTAEKIIKASCQIQTGNNCKINFKGEHQCSRKEDTQK